MRSIILITVFLFGYLPFIYAESDISKFISEEDAFRATDSQFENLRKMYLRYPSYGIGNGIVNFPNEENPYFLIELYVEKDYEKSPNVYESRKEFSQYFYVHPYTGKVYSDRASLERSYWGSNIVEADVSQLGVELEMEISIDFVGAEDFYLVAWSSDGKQIVLCQWGGIFYSINIETGALIEIFRVSRIDWIKDIMIYSKGSPSHLCFSPDNKKIAFSWANEIWQMEADGKGAQIFYQFKHGWTEGLSYSCNGEKLLANLDEKIAVVDVKTKKVSFYEGEEAKRKVAEFSCAQKAIFGNEIVNAYGDKIELEVPQFPKVSFLNSAEVSFISWETKKVVYLVGRENPILYAENIYFPHHAVRLYNFEGGYKPFSILWSPDGEKIMVLMINKENKLSLFIFSVKLRVMP